MGSSLGLDGNTKQFILENHEVGKSLILKADDIVSSGIHRHLEGGIFENSSFGMPAVRFKRDNQERAGLGVNSVGLQTFMDSVGRGILVTSSGTVSIGASLEEDGTGLSVAPTHTLNIHGGAGLKISSKATANAGYDYGRGCLYLGDKGALEFNELEWGGTYYTMLKTKTDRWSWHDDEDNFLGTLFGMKHTDDKRTRFILGSYASSPASVKVHNPTDSTTLSYDADGDSTIHFTNHFTGDASTTTGYIKGSYLGLRGTLDQAAWGNDLWIENKEASSDIHIIAPDEVRISGILDASVTPTSVARLRVNEANVEIKSALRITDATHGSQDITIDENPQFIKTIAVAGNRVQMEPTAPTPPKNFRIYDLGPNPSMHEPTSYVTFKWNWEDLEGAHDGGADFLTTAGGPQTDPGGSPSTISGMYMYFTHASSGRKYKIENCSFSSAGVSTYTLGTELSTGLQYPQSGDTANATDPARIIDNADKYVFKSIEYEDSYGNSNLLIDQVNELTEDFVLQPNYRVKLDLGKQYYVSLRAYNGFNRTDEITMLSGSYDPDQAGPQSAVAYASNFANQLPNLTPLSALDDHLALEATAFGFNATIAG